MFNPIKLYVKSQEVQLNWIRNHPFQWLALNGVLLVGFIGYIEHKDKLETDRMFEELDQAKQNQV